MVQIKACGLSGIDTKVSLHRLCIISTTSYAVIICVQTYSDLFPNAEQIPVGYEISGIVTKGK